MKLRIDEVAHRTGITSRNIRAYQARGLLPPPTLEGRTGYYGEEHLQRLELVVELQERGFSLEAIRQVLDAWSRGGNLSQLVGLQHLLDAPFSDEEPKRYALETLFDLFPEARDRPELVERATDLGLIVPREDGDVDAPSPMLIEAGAELGRIGVGLAAILDLVEGVQADTRQIADRFVAIVADSLSRLVVQGDLAERSEEVSEILSRLRPLAVEVVRPFLAWALRDSIAQAQLSFADRLDALE